MKILNLTLQNFKGIRHFNLDTQGKDANIYGDNATGKTTLARLLPEAIERGKLELPSLESDEIGGKALE